MLPAERGSRSDWSLEPTAIDSMTFAGYLPPTHMDAREALAPEGLGASRSRTVCASGYTRTVLTAFILVESTREGLAHLGSDLAAVEGVAEVYTVTRDWDFVAIVRVREH